MIVLEETVNNRMIERLVLFLARGGRVIRQPAVGAVHCFSCQVLYQQLFSCQVLI